MLTYFIVEEYKRIMDFFNGFKMFNWDTYLGNVCGLIIGCGIDNI